MLTPESTTDNKLNISSLPALQQVIKSAAQDLRDLDVSHNLISVTTDEDAQVFQDFLRCFAECCVLRRLDFSGNTLGPKAFEVLTKVYGQEEPIYLPDRGIRNGLHDEETLARSAAEPVAFEQRQRNLSTSSNHGELPSETNGGLMTPQKPHEKSKKGLYTASPLHPMLTWSLLQSAKLLPRQTQEARFFQPTALLAVCVPFPT